MTDEPRHLSLAAVELPIIEPLIFILNLALMIDEHGDEGEDIDADKGKSDSEGEDEGEDANTN
jgi:hypothetical protein